jgi:hypothetical protein
MGIALSPVGTVTYFIEGVTDRMDVFKASVDIAGTEAAFRLQIGTFETFGF